MLFVWLLWLCACIIQISLSEARRGIPEEERRSVSIFPAFPIFPLAFWGAAMLIDWLANPWGTYTIVGLHVILGLTWSVSIFRDLRAQNELQSDTHGSKHL